MNVNKKILRVLYITLVIIISIPALMFIVGLQSPGKPLEGVGHDSKEPAFTFTSFMDHRYQYRFSNYLDSRFPFEASFIRLYNQVEYKVFHNISNDNVVLGKEGFLFEPWYIESYYGNDFLGEKFIQDQVDKLAALDSVFRANGKTLIIALAPGKTYVYPEFIPDYLKEKQTDSTNYNFYARKLKEKKLNVFDFNQWFIIIKPTFERYLFPKAGTHWSEDMALVALDSLIRYIECKSGDFLNNIYLSNLRKTDIAEGSDNDLLKISNLIRADDYDEYYYWNYRFENRFPVEKNLLAISDSYFWNFYARGLSLTFKNPKFWYYFNNAYSQDEPETIVMDLNITDQIKEADYVLLMSSTTPLYKFGWGFIDEAYCRFVENPVDLKSRTFLANPDADKTFLNSGCVNQEISNIIKNIKAVPTWYELVKQKAAERNISVDSMLIIDAYYIQDN